VTCVKIRYRDRVSALYALAQTSARRKPTDKDETRAYHCPDCSGWHLTSAARRP
jgi:hypothetical protein